MKITEQDIFTETMEFWGNRTGVAPSHQEAKEMIDNVSGFFFILDEWERNLRSKEESEENKEMEDKDVGEYKSDIA